MGFPGGPCWGPGLKCPVTGGPLPAGRAWPLYPQPLLCPGAPWGPLLNTVSVPGKQLGVTSGDFAEEPQGQPSPALPGVGSAVPPLTGRDTSCPRRSFLHLESFELARTGEGPWRPHQKQQQITSEHAQGAGHEPLPTAGP